MLTEEQSSALSYGNVDPAKPEIIQTIFPTVPLVRTLFLLKTVHKTTIKHSYGSRSITRCQVLFHFREMNSQEKE